MPEVTGNISTRAAVAAVSPQLCKNFPSLLVPSSWTPNYKIVVVEWCHISERTANLIKPSGVVVLDDVTMRAIVAELVLQSYLSCKR